MKRTLNIIRRTILIILAFIVIIFITIQTDYVQNKLIKIATGKLTAALGTEVHIKYISVSLFNKLNLKGTLIRDQKQDTILYAGNLKVNITDWFFLRDKATLKYIGLEDAVIKLQRKDSTWNYQFIADYFSSPSAKKKKNKNGIELGLQKIDLSNIHFFKNDLWTGDIINAKLGGVIIDFEKVDFNKNYFLLNNIELNKPNVTLLSLPASPLRKKKLKNIAEAAADTGLYYNGSRIDLSVNNIHINNGSLFIEGDLDRPIPYFDGAHIQLSRLNGSINQLHFKEDTIRAMVNLSTKDRSGLELKKLKTRFRLTPQIMELAELDLQTNKSKIGNYYAMKFNEFNEDFNEYIDSVVMVANLTNCKIHSDDIAFFAPELTSWNKVALVGGKFSGTVADFNVNHFTANIGTTTSLYGILSMKGLPYINRTIIDFKNGTLNTTAYDLGFFMPSLRKISFPNLAALGQISYRGDFNGTIQDFRTTGIFSTQLGGLQTNISMKLPSEGEPTYSGNLEATRFNAGKFLAVPQLGLVDFKGLITGSSFNIDKLKTKLDGTVSSIEYKNYRYTNIIANGTVQKKYFNGELEINDPNLGFTADVEVDFSKKQPLINIVGDLAKSHLKELNFLTDDIEVVGLLDANFVGNDIDNFTGTTKFLNAVIKNKKNRIAFDSLNITSLFRDSIKTLRIGSNDFNALIEGKFNILSLPSSFQAFLYNYYPSYIKSIKKAPQNQQFKFNINTQYFEPYLNLFNKNILGFNDVSINGSIDTKSNQLAINVSVPYGKYQKNAVVGFDLTGKGNFDSLTVSSTIKSVEVGDSLKFPNSTISLSSRKDHSIVSINTSATNTLNKANLNADVYTLVDGATIQFSPSTFVLNDKEWNIDNGGSVTFRKDLMNAQNLKLTQGFQEISIVPGNEKDGKNNNLRINLKNIIIGDITSLFMKQPQLEGIASGSINLKNFFSNFSADAKLKAENFTMDNDSIGILNITAGYQKETGIIPFTVVAPNKEYNFNANGQYDLKDTIGNPLQTNIHLVHSKINFLESFLSDLFTKISGEASGDLSISGNPEAPDLLGNITLKNGGMNVNYTQVYYHIDSAFIQFKDDGIDFGKITIRDQYNNNATVTGKLYEKGFKNFGFDFNLNTDKLLLIDTKSTDNEQFYGKAIGKASLSFKGPESACKMSIVAEANDSSHIFIPNTESKESGAADFIVFKQYGTEMEQIKEKSNFNLLVDLDLIANNKVQIDVILDELTGDVIKAKGNGRLKIKAGSIDPLTIKGRYNIENGNYDFNFQSVLKKKFQLLPDAGNYIEWNGDPFKAELHIDAQYTAERVTLNDLIGKNSFSGSVKGYRGDVYVIAILRNELSRPDIKFRLDFPQGSPIKNDNEFAQYLTRIQKDENEMLKQVSFLIVFGSFAPAGEKTSTVGTNPYSTIGSIGINSLSQILTKEVNKALSNLLFKLTGDKSLRFDLGASMYNSSNIFGSDGSSLQANSSSQSTRMNFNFKVGKSLFNNNVIVTFGGDLDFNLGTSTSVQSGNLQWLPDLNIEIILSKDRKLRGIIFSKNSLDISGTSFGRRNRQGASISYRQDFETIFAKKEEIIEAPPADVKDK